MNKPVCIKCEKPYEPMQGDEHRVRCRACIDASEKRREELMACFPNDEVDNKEAKSEMYRAEQRRRTKWGLR